MVAQRLTVRPLSSGWWETVQHFLPAWCNRRQSGSSIWQQQNNLPHYARSLSICRVERLIPGQTRGFLLQGPAQSW